ncbi:type I secretion system permease/ATPase [Sulfurimonas sp.]|uniref:type I secretion system permease/ATPase n=1 Tax=Sulfurimonas sp. TaxID=2022749 RepID=UPI00262605BD|nr:type I secretion system permease/ATPase [Sulfurimonas sp.]
MSLLNSLSLYTKLYAKPYSVESLSAGLPKSQVEDDFKLFSSKSSKSLFSRAASRAGLKSTLSKKSLNEIIDLHLPCILLLSENNSCILESFSDDRKKAKIIFAEDEPLEEWIDVDKLQEIYLGYLFLIKKEYQYKKDIHKVDTHNKHWFFDTLKLSAPIYKDVLLASVLVNLFVLATPLFTMNVYDRVIPNNAKETLFVFTTGVVLAYIIDISLKYSRTYLLEIAAKKSDIIMSSMIFERVLDLKMASHPKSVGSFASNLKDFDSIRSFLTNSTTTALVDLPFTILFLFVIYYIGGSIVIIPIITIALILLYAFIIQKPLAKSIEDTHEVSAKKSNVIIEALQNIETIKTHNLSSTIQHDYEEATGEMAHKSLKSRLMSASVPTITSFLIQLNTVLIVFYGVYLINDFELTMGALIAVVILTSRTIAPVGQAAALITNYSDAKASYEVIENIISQPRERPIAKEFIQRLTYDGKIEFRNVSFAYEQEGVLALNDVSFTINSGEKVAIIGRIGSGKSTIEKLILSLYTPTKGSILIDDIDISQIDPADLRSHISYVPQDIHLFKGTIKSNIKAKFPHATDEAMIKAARLSGVEEFVLQHPHGYEMVVNDRGMGLSGGQRQSVGIARAFLNESKILLLDEPTNSMDTLSEQRFIDKLQKHISDETMILVTQKMNLLSLVDRVIVIHNGCIELDGPRHEVIEKLGGGKVEK